MFWHRIWTRSFLTKNYKTIGVKVVYDQSDHACEHIRLGRIDTIALKRKVDEPLGSRKRSWRTTETTIDTVELLSDCKTYFRSKLQFFCSKTNVIFRKPFILAPEHARSILMVDLNSSKWRLIGWFRINNLKPFVRGKSGRWSHRVSDKDGLEDGFQQ
jgi:hypothetical protein